MHILFRCTNHSNLPFYKHSLVVIYWSLYLSSTADMLSSDLTFYFLHHYISYALNTCKTGRWWNYYLYLSVNCIRKHSSDLNLPILYTTFHNFLFIIHSKPCWLQGLIAKRWSNFPFKASHEPLTSSKSTKWSNSSRHPDLIFLDNNSSTIKEPRELNSEPYSTPTGRVI